MPDYPEEAIQRAAERIVERKLTETWTADPDAFRRAMMPRAVADVTDALDVAAPILAEAVAAKILAFMEECGPAEGGGTGRRSSRYIYRAHFGTAARVAARAFTTRDEELRQAAVALASGNYAACYLDDAGQPAGEGEQ